MFRSMVSAILFAIAAASTSALYSDELQNCSEVTVYTTEGDIVLSLYNDTPLHRRNFLDNVESGVYDERTFNRVVEGFVIQCGGE